MDENKTNWPVTRPSLKVHRTGRPCPKNIHLSTCCHKLSWGLL